MKEEKKNEFKRKATFEAFVRMFTDVEYVQKVFNFDIQRTETYPEVIWSIIGVRFTRDQWENLMIAFTKMTELPVFIQINTEEDIDRWMAGMDCDPRPEYGLEDYKGAYWEITPENIEYNPAIRAGAKTMSDLWIDNPNAQFIFRWGSPTRLSLESFSNYVAETAMGWDAYFENEEDYKDICDIEDEIA